MNAALHHVEPRLTDEHRVWLNAPERRSMLTAEFVVQFIHRFGLHPRIAGRILSQWVRELAQ